MLEVIGEPSALAKADKIYSATHRVVVEEVRPQRDPDSKFWDLCKSRTQKFRDFQHRREIPTSFGASADLFGFGQGFFAGAYRVDRLKGELPVPLLPTLSGVGPVVTLDLAPEVIRTIIAGIWAAFFQECQQ